ncbi:MAG: hypothetical protein QHH07_10600 [Sedimentisphaerales bacterium]|nr:hypothetical protein [Sedimentisphaerales bacterium]
MARVHIQLWRGFIYNFDDDQFDYFDTVPGAFNIELAAKDGARFVGNYNLWHGLFYDGTNVITLDYPGALFTQLTDIQGNLIVGYYKDNSDRYHGLVYTIPAPSAIVLAGMGLWAISVLRGRRVFS